MNQLVYTTITNHTEILYASLSECELMVTADQRAGWSEDAPFLDEEIELNGTDLSWWNLSQIQAEDGTEFASWIEAALASFVKMTFGLNPGTYTVSGSMAIAVNIELTETVNEEEGFTTADMARVMPNGTRVVDHNVCVVEAI